MHPLLTAHIQLAAWREAKPSRTWSPYYGIWLDRMRDLELFIAELQAHGR